MPSQHKHAYELTTLKNDPVYYSAVLELIERSFDYESCFHFDQDFLPLMEKSNWQNCHLLVDKDHKKVVGHIGTLTVKTNSPELSVVMLGGICIDPAYQGKGLLNSLLNKAMHSNLDADIFMLWSNLHDLYRKYDFEPSFEIYQIESSFQIQPTGIDHTWTPVSLSKLQDYELEQLYKLYHETTVDHFSPKREKQQWLTMKDMKSLETWVKRDHAGNIQSYFIKNKGMDLQGIIHEWGGLSSLNQFFEVTRFGKLWLSKATVTDFRIAENNNLITTKLIGALAKKQSNKVHNLKLNDLIFYWPGSYSI